MFIYRNIATPIGLMEHLQETRFSQKSKGVALTLPSLTNSESQGCPPFSTQESILKNIEQNNIDFFKCPSFQHFKHSIFWNIQQNQSKTKKFIEDHRISAEVLHIFQLFPLCFTSLGRGTTSASCPLSTAFPRARTLEFQLCRSLMAIYSVLPSSTAFHHGFPNVFR